MKTESKFPLLTGEPARLVRYLSHALHEQKPRDRLFPPDPSDPATLSAVLLLLGQQCGTNGTGPCLILNKRSGNVPQPGDLCCPGGSLTPRLDTCLSRMITLPGFPMTRWPHWSHWQRHHPAAARRLSLFFATGLREGFEEMRLNPFGVKLIGPLPPERLRIFRRVIYPLVGWVSRQKHFHPNREVDRVVYIPLKSLLEPAHYACYRVQYDARIRRKLNRASQDFPCFRYEAGAESEVLWGATFRIVMTFLEIAFGFRPPPPDTLPVISGKLRGGYLGGRKNSGQ